MTAQEKTLARDYFKLKIYKADGTLFERLFTDVMNYHESEFQQIKPWGNIGDRKNDGYCKRTGTFYQVYAPEEVRNSYPDVVDKLKNDFAGLKKHWTPVNEFYFVVNDKYHGVNADCEREIQRLVKEHKLRKGGFWTPKDLERVLFELEDDQILSIVGHLPNLDPGGSIDFATLNEVIGYIMKIPRHSYQSALIVPDWNQKIHFNKLGPVVKSFLDINSQKLGYLNEYLANENFLAQQLQEKLAGIYLDAKQNIETDQDDLYSGDLIFWEIVKMCSPRDEDHFTSPIVTIIAKYFESCDIFEEPK
ncbi:MAG TPA: hypothetical protein VGN64_19785 [Dyadobacter sp.]|jgi:hypothetical protein|nr:hypothetical protein [Dyadobacter sp.]